MESEKLIINKLDMIKQELDYIRSHIDDVTLTDSDLISLEDAEQDLKKGKTKRL